MLLCIHKYSMTIIDDIQLLKSGSKLISTRLNINNQKFGSICKEILNITKKFTNMLWSERIYLIENNLIDPPICIVCNQNPQKWIGKAYCKSKTCGNICSNKSKNRTDNRNKTMMAIYGSLISNKSRLAIKSRTKNLNIKGRITLQNKYGVNNASQIIGHADKVKSTNLRKYGTESFWTSDTGINKIENNRKNHYQDLFKNLNHIEYKTIENPNFDWQKNSRIVFKCTKCNLEQTLASETLKFRLRNFNDICTSCLGMFNGSQIQKTLYEFIKSIDSEIKMNYVLPNRKQLDIFVPKLNMGFELNGNFWHSFKSIESKNERHKHQDKTLFCQTQGIKLIQIWESDWIKKNILIKQKIEYMLGKSNKIMARKTQIQIVDNLTAKEFYDKYHIQGYLYSNINLGLYHNNVLVMMMSFSKSRYDKKFQYELTRMASSDCSVTGGASKLFKFFIKTYNPENILCYSDLCWGKGDVYSTIGMLYEGNTKPGYHYLSKEDLYLKLLNRSKFQKYKLKKLLSNFDNNLSEAENMFNHNYRRLWDCGNAKYTWKKAP